MKKSIYKMHKIMRERLFKVHKGAGPALCKPIKFLKGSRAPLRVPIGKEDFSIFVCLRRVGRSCTSTIQHDCYFTQLCLAFGKIPSTPCLFLPPTPLSRGSNFPFSRGGDYPLLYFGASFDFSPGIFSTSI